MALPLIVMLALMVVCVRFGLIHVRRPERIVGLLVLLVIIGFWGSMAYVAFHFVTKYW